MCGQNFEDASTHCDTPCPTGSPSECPTGESCFTHTTCANNEKDEENQPTPAPTPPYIPGDSSFVDPALVVQNW